MIANPENNPMKKLCGARTRADRPCRNPSMSNGRCRFHGGLSTGPRTAEGLARMRRAKTKHGMNSAEAVRLRKHVQALKRGARKLVELV